MCWPTISLTALTAKCAWRAVPATANMCASPRDPLTRCLQTSPGPFLLDLNVVKAVRYALVTVFSQAVTDGDPKDFPLPSYEEGLELLEEEGVAEAEELPSFEKESRDADDQDARWQAVKEACQEPVRTRNFIQVVPLARKNRYQVLLGLQKCYTRLGHLGFRA